MTRAFLPALVAASLVLSACTSAKVTTQAPVPASVQAPVSAASTPSDSKSQPAPAPAPSTGAATTAPSSTAPSHTPPASAGSAGQADKNQVPPQPAIKWNPRGIGLPVVSEDPAAAGKKVVVLTFDDGPSDTGSTARVLDVLAEHNVKAMFFITGYGAKPNMDLVKRIHREGHVLGPHTMTHPNLARLPVAKMREEIEPLNKLIEEVTGQKPKWLRPPFGAYNQPLIDLLKEWNMEVLNWTNGSLDWEGTKDGYKDPKTVVDDVMKQLHPGAVILFHDTLKHTAEALPEVLTRIKAEGYEFTVLPNQ